MNQQETPGFDPIGAARDRAYAALPGICATLAEERPARGVRVEVTKGRKYKGACGIVFWHGEDRFSRAGRYCDSLADALRRARGVYGYRIGVVTESGERFFVPADYVRILRGAQA